jgi:nucleoside-diphosphate-sugar epimerase/intein/homing endonuclease
MKELAVVMGGGGFIGGYLCIDLLRQGYAVRSVDILPFRQWQQVHVGVENLQLDLRKLENCKTATKGADRIYQLACDMGGMGFIENNKCLCMISVLINTHVLIAAKEEEVKRFFYSSSACFLPDSLCITKNGITRIQDVQKFEYILTHTGDFHRVKDTSSRNYKGNICKINLYGVPSIHCTPDHRIFVNDEKWEKAAELSGKDFVIIPKPNLSCVDCDDIILDLPPNNIHYLTLQKGEIKNISAFASSINVSNHIVYRWNNSSRLSKHLDPVLNDSIIINSDLGELIGIYLAEGWIENSSEYLSKDKVRKTRSSVLFSFGSHETELIERTSSLLSRVFGIPRYKIRSYSGGSAVKLEIVSEVLSLFFKKHCYKNNSSKYRCYNKAIHQCLFCSNEEFLQSLLYGYWMGDGCRNRQANNTDRNILSSTSKELIWQLRTVCLSLGIYTSIQVRSSGTDCIENRIVNRRESYHLYAVGVGNLLDNISCYRDFKIDNQYCGKYMSFDGVSFRLKVQDIELEQYDGDVYNMEVERNPSYTIMNIAVHNCVYNASKQTDANVIPLKEEDAYPAMPEDGYGWEKLFSERLCRHFREDFGLITRVARFHNVYGPLGTWTGGREKAPAAICRKVAEAKLSNNLEIEIWGDGTRTRSFQYIDDCITGINLIMESDITDPINLGTSELVTINQLVDIVEDIAGVKLHRKYNTAAPQGVKGRNSDNTMIKKYLNWEPSIPLRVGLEKTYEWIYDKVRA